MNDLLQFLKDGSGIHIKKSQRGSFTKYCNGKVTNECIQRGKNSSNPKIRKKAVFAENSRKWHHLQGGVLLTFGEGGITDSLIDFVILKEGFNETPIDIGDGKITIGSGLTAKKWIDLYNLKGVWSKEDNRAAVTEELLNRLKWALESIPNWNKLNKNLQDALLSYKYNYDFNHINSPKLFDYLRKGDFYNASQEINATSKNPDFKKGLEKRRKEELKLFSKEVEQTVKTISLPKIPIIASDATHISNTYYPKQYRIIPTKKGSYIETDKGLILKEILDTRMKLLKMKPRVPEPYKFPILFKKGGKGFVKNVNVLDSNPRLYKEEKKRFPIKKGANGMSFGLKLSNIGNKVNTFMNSDWGLFAKSALTGIKDIISANKLVSANADLARANTELNYANEIKNIGYKLYLEENTLKAQQLAATIKALTGDIINVSPIDIAHKAWQLAYSGQAADLKAKDLRMIDNQEIADKTNNVMSGIMNIGQGVLGMLSNPMKQINKFNLNYINNYLSVTAPLNYMKSIKELGIK